MEPPSHPSLFSRYPYRTDVCSRSVVWLLFSLLVLWHALGHSVAAAVLAPERASEQRLTAFVTGQQTLQASPSADADLQALYVYGVHAICPFGFAPEDIRRAPQAPTLSPIRQQHSNDDRCLLRGSLNLPAVPSPEAALPLTPHQQRTFSLLPATTGQRGTIFFALPPPLS